MALNIYGNIALIGGGVGALDRSENDGAGLADKDPSITYVQNDAIYFHVLDVDSAATEASPAVIAPDTNPGDKRWLLNGVVRIPNGATLPTNPIKGESFLHTPTGRSIFMVYNGTSWVGIQSMSSMTIYVDSTDGTDSINQGTGVDAAAYKTVQYAVDSIPGINSGDVIIYINGETYTESVTIQGKSFTGAYTITLEGTMTLTGGQATTTLSGVGDAVTAYSSGTQATITDASQAWTTNTFANKIFRIVAGSGYDSVYTWKNDYIIESNTSTVLTLIGSYFTTPVAGGGTPTQYQILDFSSIVDPSTASSYAININSQNGVIIKQLKFSLSSANNSGAVQFKNTSIGKIFTCYAKSTTTISFAMYSFANFSTCLNTNCIYAEASSTSGKGFALTYNSQTVFSEGDDQFYGLTNSFFVTKEGIYLAFNGYFMYGGGYSNKLKMNGATHGFTCLIGSYADLYNCIINMSGSSAGYGLFVSEGSRARLRSGNDIFSAAGDGVYIGILSLLNVSSSGSKVRNNGGWGLNTATKSLGVAVSSNITYTSNTTGTYTSDASSTNT